MQATNGGVAASPATSTDADCNAAGGPAVELPLHLTEKVLCSISPLESVRHAIVCKSWAASVSARLARPVPHLFLCMPPSINPHRRSLVVSVPLDGAIGIARSPSARKIPARGVRSSDTNGLRCIGATPGGRVAFCGWWSADVVLVNPVTGVHQPINVGEQGDPRFSRVLAGDDSFFAVEGYRLMLWQRKAQGGEDAWSKQCAVTAAPTNNILSAVNCNGCFYLLHEDWCLSKVDANVPPPLRMEKLPVASLADKSGSGHLLESDGEVLFVRELPARKDEVTTESCMSSLSVGGFEVYRLDVKEQRWTKVDKLAAGRALFVSPGSSFAVRASEVEGCRSNCIYFAGKNQHDSSPACREGGETSWGLYSMEDRRVLFEHVVTETRGGAEVLWFLPRVSLGSLYKSLGKCPCVATGLIKSLKCLNI